MKQYSVSMATSVAHVNYIRLHCSVSKSVGLDMARGRKSKQNMQKDIVQFTKVVPTNESILLADIIPDQEILVKRVILNVAPVNRPDTGTSSLSGTYLMGVTESDNGQATPSDLGSEQRLVRSTTGNAYGINNVDTVLTMRKEGGSGVHAIYRNYDAGSVTVEGQLIIHFLEV